jgi:hypothetical protein
MDLKPLFFKRESRIGFVTTSRPEVYNGYCKNGKDADFCRPKEDLRALEHPLYAIELWPALINTQGGPRRDKEAGVLDPEGQPIPRLYKGGVSLAPFGGICLEGRVILAKPSSLVRSLAGTPLWRALAMSALVTDAEIASKDFVVNASRERVWRLIGMEEIEILDENSFWAMLKVKASFLEFKMKLKATLNMTSAEGGKTTVACKAMALDIGTLFRVLFLGQARRFAPPTFETMKNGCRSWPEPGHVGVY